MTFLAREPKPNFIDANMRNSALLAQPSSPNLFCNVRQVASSYHWSFGMSGLRDYSNSTSLMFIKHRRNRKEVSAKVGSDSNVLYQRKCARQNGWTTTLRASSIDGERGQNLLRSEVTLQALSIFSLYSALRSSRSNENGMGEGQMPPHCSCPSVRRSLCKPRAEGRQSRLAMQRTCQRERERRDGPRAVKSLLAARAHSEEMSDSQRAAAADLSPTLPPHLPTLLPMLCEREASILRERGQMTLFLFLA